MDYVKEYKKFVNSYYFNEAIRITVGITLPALVFLFFFDMLHLGLLFSLGAMVTSASDIPGPIHQRRNGMMATIVLIFFIANIVGFAAPYPALLIGVIAVFCFLLSMLGVYGARVNAIGFAGMLIMILSQDHRASGWDIPVLAGYLSLGGIWYMLLSLALFTVRPYRVVQQALGDSILAIADYLRIRSEFYNEEVDYDKTYLRLMEKQLEVQDKHILLREMLFKSRNIVKESTTTGRTLLIIFIESIDLFEKATATFYNYQSMHKRFDGTSILPHFQKMIIEIVLELHKIGIAVQSGRSSLTQHHIEVHLASLKKHYEVFLDTHRSPENLEALVNMRKIMQSIEDMCLRIYTLHQYTSYNKERASKYVLTQDYEAFVTPTSIKFQLFKENLSLSSNTFRHAIRVSIAITLGYIVALLLNLGHSYWVLLTILVILKPTYSLSKERNINRLVGTILGALFGIGVLYAINNQTGHFIAMIILMIGTYSFMRTKYLLSVFFMTAFVLIFFFLLDSKDFVVILEHRIIDTIIGSIIAFTASFILVPNWEKQKIKSYMTEALEKSIAYFKNVADSFSTNTVTELDYKLSRRDAFVAQANLSGAFTRMLNEPKSMQQNSKKIHQFVVFIFTLNSHVATLSYFSREFAKKYSSDDFKDIEKDIIYELDVAQKTLADENVETQKLSAAAQQLKDDVQEILDKRRIEIQQGLLKQETAARIALTEYKPIVDQFLLISRISSDIKKLAATIEEK